jgi:hypothetical protein
MRFANRTGSWIFIAIAVAAIGVAALLALGLGRVILTGDLASGGELATPTVTSLDAENIALYPGAQQVEIDPERPELPAKVTRFVTTDNSEKVIAYYKAALSGTGWTIYAQYSSRSMEFAWTDP